MSSPCLCFDLKSNRPRPLKFLTLSTTPIWRHILFWFVIDVICALRGMEFTLAVNKKPVTIINNNQPWFLFLLRKNVIKFEGRENLVNLTVTMTKNSPFVLSWARPGVALSLLPSELLFSGLFGRWFSLSDPSEVQNRYGHYVVKCQYYIKLIFLLLDFF